MFGSMRQSDREFACSNFSNHVDKQNRKFDLAYESDLRMAKEDTQSGYQETFTDFIEASRTDEICSGPCQVDSSKGISTTSQLFPHVKHCLHSRADKMKPLFDLLEVKRDDKCVFYNKAESITELLKQ